MATEIIFEIGGRYRNRKGWYEVLDIKNNTIKVRYEMDGQEVILNIELQKRIIANISQEEEFVIPHEDDSLNQKYFKTLGFLSKNVFVEAIIPPKSKAGFDKSYHQIKGHYPKGEQPGYYVHNEPNVDKWGVEMRLTFPTYNIVAERDLNFGGNFELRSSPNSDELRINSNELCFRLLKLGFNLGINHDIEEIISKIPEKYRVDFLKG